MSIQDMSQNPLEDAIVEEVAESVAAEMITEIRDEIAVWVEKLPITSPKVRSSDVTKAFQERFARQLVERQGEIAKQIALRRRTELRPIQTGQVRKEVLACERHAVLDREADFLAHVLQCALLASRIVVEKEAFERRDGGVVESVEREMEAVLRRDAETWLQLGKVSEAEFEKEWQERFGKE